MYRRSLLIIGTMLVWLAGCAAPRYQTVSRLEPPSDPAAKPCIDTCEAALVSCRSACAEKRQACLKSIEADVEADYAAALTRYAADLDLYRVELERYRLDLWLGWGHGRWWYEPWPAYFMPAIAPSPPRREAVRDRLARERCDADCGCQPQYEACFVNCGGRKFEETRCIANCPKP